MNHKEWLIGLLLSFVLCGGLVASAQPALTNAAPSPAPATNGLSGREIRDLAAEVAGLVNASKTNLPDLLNEALAKHSGSNSPLAWLQALHLRFKAFEPSGAGKDAGLGVEYSFEKVVTGAQVFGQDNPAFLTFDLRAKGTIAFDKENNPADFLQSGVRLNLWQYFGQTKQELPTIDPNDPTKAPLTLSARTHRTLAHPPFSNMTGQQIRESAEWRTYIQHAVELEPNDFYYAVTGNADLEANQTFSKKQWAYGVELHPRFRSWNPDSVWSKFNVFDWPFAVTRSFTEKKIRPRGYFLPHVMGGIDLIDPVNNSDRFTVDPDKGVYPRVKAEVGFRSKVIEFEDGRTIWFNADYRYFQEMGASSAIRDADMDTQHYFAASLDLPWNFSITYSVGKLPFDLEDQHVWALGYRVNF